MSGAVQGGLLPCHMLIFRAYAIHARFEFVRQGRAGICRQVAGQMRAVPSLGGGDELHCWNFASDYPKYRMN
jgi:hypothetical protein